MAVLEARILSSVGEVDRAAWDRLFGSASEGYDYLRACENARPDSFELYAIGVFAGDELVAGAPLFQVDIRLDLLVEGWLQTLLAILHRRLPGGLTLTLLGVGSPHVDELPFAISAELDAAQRLQVLEAIDTGLQTHAKCVQADIVMFKNITESQHHWMGPFVGERGFATILGLPVACLTMPESEEQYISSLSANMRSNFRRKLKKGADIRLQITDSVDGIESELMRLRDATLARAPTDYDAFEELSPGYLGSVLAHLGDKARLLLYWRDDQIIGFALVLLEPGRLKEKCTGMRYPEALDHGLFFINWISIVRLCMARGIERFHAGETTYLTKARLGCQLSRSRIYYRHARPLLNLIARAAARWFNIDAQDPDLRRLGADAPYTNGGAGS